MLSRSQIQFLRTLHDKSGRQESRCFIVEGKKGILEFLDSDFEMVEGFFTEKFVDSLPSSVAASLKKVPYSTLSSSELGRITTLKSNDAGVLVMKIPKREVPTVSKDELVLVLDSINDPGNLGTIIRIADWYGVKHIICSLDTVDCYNPKVVIATMGSLKRVEVFYTDLVAFFGSPLFRGSQRGYPSQPPLIRGGASETSIVRTVLRDESPRIYGAYLDGENTHTKKFSGKGGYLVIGSESHGISPKLEKYITDKITIPRFGGAESLNAGVATGIILDSLRR